MDSRIWFIYLLRCANGALYTGITLDVQRRLAQHNAGKGSRYVRAHRPAKLVGTAEVARGKGMALQLEASIKKLPRAAKIAALQSIP